MSNLTGSTLSFPFAPDIRGSLKTISNRSDIVAQAIQDVLETRISERVMLNNYGINDFVFGVQDFGFAARLAYQLELQILRYVPLVKAVRVESATDEVGRATVEIKYTEVGAVNAPRNLVFPVWRLIE